jgi:3-deoxy-manno-octulosonate cytidylyltransferase (CMP-KDO synthetase)
MDYVVVIPVRLTSSRLPRKPLAEICGKSMLEHTYARAVEAVCAEKVFIATDSDEILQVCEKFGAQVVMTSVDCLTGTDRIAEFAQKVSADVYINLQGDEPLMEPGNIKAVIKAGLAAPTSIINGWAWIETEAEFRSRTIPKVIVRQDGQMMYMSRAPIPGTKDNSFQFSRKQICVYSFPRKALADFTKNGGKTPHEEVEDIEILRFAEMGWEVQMIELSGTSIAVDTPEDLERVRCIMAKR